MTEIVLTYNPFDHLNPVSDPTLLVGREQEVHEIRYYLDQAKTAPRAFNLAVLGARGSGKTSILNMIEREARNRDFAVARIDFNKSDAETHLVFCFKIFDSIIQSIVSEHKTDSTDLCFGGPAARVFDAYLDCISSFTIPDPLWRVFTFPTLFARAMQIGRRDALVSEQALKADLLAIQNEVGRPIVLLVDECNVLSKSESLLQLLRNTFMNIPGYMLVLSGTPDLFPLMNEVFSPIARQFKRIELNPFSQESETERCILTPLRSAGIDAASSQAVKLSPATLKDIHTLTGGKPHEIQLVCHCLARRFQTQNKIQFVLDVEILDEVLAELRRGTDLTGHPLLTKVRSLDASQLKRLSVFTRTSGATLEEIRLVDALQSRGIEKPADELVAWRDEFTRMGLLNEENGVIRFAGDEFEQIYCRYFSRRNGVLEFQLRPIRSVLSFSVDDYLDEVLELERLAIPIRFNVSPDGGELPKEIAEFPHQIEGSRFAWLTLYGAALDAALDGATSYEIAFSELSYVTVFNFDCYVLKAGMSQNGLPDMGKLCELLERYGARFSWWSTTRPAPSVEELVDLAKSQPANIQREIADSLRTGLYYCYVETKNLEKSRKYVDAIMSLGETARIGAANNLGYFALSLRQLDSAIALLRESLETDSRDKQLCAYNLVVAYALAGELDKAREVLSTSGSLALGASVGCLWRLDRVDGEIVATEHFKPDIDEFIAHATTLLGAGA